ncbi:MAG: alpha/beta hydrolase [Sphaerochaetaceae bacterium]|nr:alpha/beta hydrolase [Sphaerochaetaceae bacterium]
MKIEQFKVGPADGKVICYLHDSLVGVCETNALRPAILLIAGGGYEHISPRESDPVAMKFFAHGINVFLLKYSCAEKIKISKPIFEAAEAMCTIRKRAKEFCVDENQVAILGFSAGGHLALSVAALSDEAILSAYPDCRPNAALLIYPVVTSGEFAHTGSFDYLCESEEERAFYSLENHIDEKMMPVFLLHAANDPSVPVENSLLLASALSRNKIPFEMHIYPEGGHGFATATKEVGVRISYNREWTELAARWLLTLFEYTE